MKQNVGTIGVKRTKLLVHDVEWFCKILSENIQISMFVDKLMGIMERLSEKGGRYDLEELDACMKKMPEIEYEDKITKMLLKGQKNLHEQGEKAYDGFYSSLKNLLDDLLDAECLFTDDTMRSCGETDEDMFYENQEGEDD